MRGWAIAVSTAKLMSGEETEASEYFPFLAAPEQREMTPEEQDKWMTQFAAQFGGGKDK